MKKFKSPWFYWHTEHKFIALLSMLVSTVILWIFLVVGAGFSIWGIIIAVLLDAVGLWVALIYMVALRDYIGDIDNSIHNIPLINNFDFISSLYLQDKADNLVITNFVIPLIVGFVVSRISSYVVAKMGGYKFA